MAGSGNRAATSGLSCHTLKGVACSGVESTGVLMTPGLLTPGMCTGAGPWLLGTVVTVPGVAVGALVHGGSGVLVHALSKTAAETALNIIHREAVTEEWGCIIVVA